MTISDGNLNLVEEVLARDGAIAAAIIEPSGASWGRVPLEVEFLRGLREITQRHGVLLIFDEVVTGFRFSPGGAQQLYDVLPDLTCLAKILAGGMPGGAVVGRTDVMQLFDRSGDPHRDRHGRVTHFGTFNASPTSAAAGIALLKKVATGGASQRADAMAAKLRAAWSDVLERKGIAGFVYGPSSTFHVYFETDRERLAGTNDLDDLRTTDASRLKGMPEPLLTQYARLLRFYGVDFLSSTGGVVSTAHTDGDIEHATWAFEKTVVALAEGGLVYLL